MLEKIAEKLNGKRYLSLPLAHLSLGDYLLNTTHGDTKTIQMFISVPLIIPGGGVLMLSHRFAQWCR